MANELLTKIKNLLLNRKTEIAKEIDELKQKDPFMQEYKQDGFRNADELEEEVTDLSQHQAIDALKSTLQDEQKAIDDSLDKLNKGKYGICEKCQGPIEPERLALVATANLCAKCAKN